MNRLTKLLLIAHAVEFVAIHAPGQQVRDFVLDDHTVYAVPVSGTRVTTVSFPSPIAAIDGAAMTTDGKTPGLFQLAHTKGTAYFSVRALTKDAAANVNVRWNNRTYVFELRESAEPCYSLLLRSPSEKSGLAARPLTPNRLLGLLDKAKAFPLLQQYQPEAVRDVEYRDCRAKPIVSDCGGYEVRLFQAFRFPQQDTLIFEIAVVNNGEKLLIHTPEQLEIRVAEQVFTPSVADLAGEVPPKAALTGYIVLTGTPNGGRNELSLKNDFAFALNRRDAAVDAAVRDFDQAQTEGFAK
jgi:hypothetical protein